MSEILCGGTGIRLCASAFGAVGGEGPCVARSDPTGDLSILRTWKPSQRATYSCSQFPFHPNKGSKSVRAVLSHRYAKSTPALLVSDRVLISSSTQHSCKPQNHHAYTHFLPNPLPLTGRSIHLMPPCNLRPRSRCVSADDKRQQWCERQCLCQCDAPIVSPSGHSLRRPHSRPYA